MHVGAYKVVLCHAFVGGSARQTPHSRRPAECCDVRAAESKAVGLHFVAYFVNRGRFCQLHTSHMDSQDLIYIIYSGKTNVNRSIEASRP